MLKPRLLSGLSFALGLVSLLPSLSGCATAVVATGGVGALALHDRRSFGTLTDDESTEWKAAARLPEKYRDSAHLNFTSYNRKLLITGEVPNEQARQEIQASLRGIEGIRQIHDESAVMPPSSLAARSRDSLTDAKVKARLIEDKQLSANHIKVVTERGTTYLMGLVGERESKIAIEIARTTDGVRRVVSLFEILSDAELRRHAPPPASPPAPVESR
ncbi:BON domain-containing protein [Dechloromonas sp. ZY10]|uniref:BON domain-containing protein n=1 Tax=Dechloromonas aquae TaxID=2664436 RepID=UPI0035283038